MVIEYEKCSIREIGIKEAVIGCCKGCEECGATRKKISACVISISVTVMCEKCLCMAIMWIVGYACVESACIANIYSSSVALHPLLASALSCLPMYIVSLALNL